MTSSTSWISPLPVRRVTGGPAGGGWPYTLAPVRQLLADGLDLAQATVLVGENGTGKSTLVEAIAMAYGLAPEGGSTGARHSTRVTESELAERLQLQRGAGASRWGYFLRAETMHGLFTYLERDAGFSPRFHQQSHGESFLDMITDDRFTGDGLYVLDEPEAGLSFTAQLTLVGQLLEMLSSPGTQVLLATHSPVIAALPGARLLQLSDAGITPVTWEDLEVVDHYRRFLAAPERYLRHLR